MTVQTPTKVLITGVSGYIGGSILNSLLNSIVPSIQKLQLSALVRSQNHADWLRKKGVTPYLFEGFEDLETIEAAARENDVVINAASGFATEVAKSLILGLGSRKKTTGKDVLIIHTSGTSNVGNRPITKKYLRTSDLSDVDDDIYGYLQHRESEEPYHQRTTDIVVVETAKAVDVKAYILMSPTIYGFGTGSFNTVSIQVPLLVKVSLKVGQSVHVGEGLQVWDYVHISDLADLYTLLLTKVLEKGNSIPSGEKGIFFTATGRYQWKGLAEGIGRAGHELGYLPTSDTKAVSIEEAIELGLGLDEQVVELGFASNATTRSDFAHSVLGWEPKKTDADWEKSLKEEFAFVAKKQNA